jgi:hypothetical protein
MRQSRTSVATWGIFSAISSSFKRSRSSSYLSIGTLNQAERVRCNKRSHSASSYVSVYQSLLLRELRLYLYPYLPGTTSIEF